MVKRAKYWYRDYQPAVHQPSMKLPHSIMINDSMIPKPSSKNIIIHFFAGQETSYLPPLKITNPPPHYMFILA